MIYALLVVVAEKIYHIFFSNGADPGANPGPQYQNNGAGVNYSGTIYQYPGSLNQNDGGPYFQGVPIQLPGIDFLVIFFVKIYQTSIISIND